MMQLRMQISKIIIRILRMRMQILLFFASASASTFSSLHSITHNNKRIEYPSKERRFQPLNLWKTDPAMKETSNHFVTSHLCLSLLTWKPLTLVCLHDIGWKKWLTLFSLHDIPISNVKRNIHIFFISFQKYI